MGTHSDNLHTTAIVPVKGMSVANGRLDGLLSASERQRLAEALFLDLIVKLPRSRSIDDLLIVTADESIARQARWFDHKILLQEADEGHSEAARAGARAALADGADRVAMLPVDCPLLDVDDLDAHVGRSPRTVLIAPDRHGTGTNALLLSPPDVMAPAFGPGSFSRHVEAAKAAGAVVHVERLASLALDVDTAADLDALRASLDDRPGAAPRTRAVLAHLTASPA